MDTNKALAWRKSLRWICGQFVERSEALNYKGKRRDDAAIDFLCGAAATLKATGHDTEAEWLGRVVYLEIATRGFKAVQRISTQAIEGE